MTSLIETPNWNDLTVRAAAPGEEEAIVALIHLVYAALDRPHPPSAAQYQQVLTAPFFDPQQDRCVVANAAGMIVGYAHLQNRMAFTRMSPAVYVHPDYQGRGIGSHLTTWAEARARELVHRAPPHETVFLACGIASTQTDAAQLLGEHGYAPVRHFLDLQADLTTAPAPPQWPPHMAVRAMIPGQDELAVYRVYNETFMDHWDYVPVSEEDGFARFMQRIDGNPKHDPTLWFLVHAQRETGEPEVAGYALCDPTGWINLLGVRRQWRRRGLAAALVNHVFGEFWRRGVREIHLNVDGDSPTGAVQLYVRAGMRPVHQVDIYFKELRPAQDATAALRDSADEEA